MDISTYSKPLIITDAAIIYIAAHLMRKWPRTIDPLHRLATRLGR